MRSKIADMYTQILLLKILCILFMLSSQQNIETMKKTLLLISLCFASLFNFAQTLNYELNFNDGIQNELSHLTGRHAFLYGLLYENGAHDNAGTYFIRLDTITGKEIAKTRINPDPMVYSTFKGMTQGISGFYVNSVGRYACDMINPCSQTLQKLGYNGNEVWQVSYSDSACLGYEFSGITPNDDNSVYTVYSNGLSSHLMHYDDSGNTLDSISINDTINNITRMLTNRDGNIMMAKDNALMLVSISDGSVLAVNYLNGSIQQLVNKYNTDRVYIITENELYEIEDTTLTIVKTANLGYNNYGYDNDDGFGYLPEVISMQSNRLVKLELNWDLEILDSLVIQLDNPGNYDALLAPSRTYVFSKHQLTNYHSARLVSYFTNNMAPLSLNRTDVGLITSRITDENISESQNEPHVYDVRLRAEVLVKNYGPAVLNSVRITSLLGNGICDIGYYQEEFDSLSINPGDSAWIDLGWEAARDYDYYENDSIHYTFCAFTSDANKLADLTVENDDSCEDYLFTTTRIAENKAAESFLTIFPNPATDFLNLSDAPIKQLHIYNIEGKSVKQITSPHQQINIADLLPGYYYLKADMNNGERQVAKFVKK